MPVSPIPWPGVGCILTMPPESSMPPGRFWSRAPGRPTGWRPNGSGGAGSPAGGDESLNRSCRRVAGFRLVLLVLIIQGVEVRPAERSASAPFLPSTANGSSVQSGGSQDGRNSDTPPTLQPSPYRLTGRTSSPPWAKCPPTTTRTASPWATRGAHKTDWEPRRRSSSASLHRRDTASVGGAPKQAG